jgi:hypothetical protein
VKKKIAMPGYQWPWCDRCEAHVREIDGVRHACLVRVFVQLAFAWAGR